MEEGTTFQFVNLDEKLLARLKKVGDVENRVFTLQKDAGGWKTFTDDAGTEHKAQIPKKNMVPIEKTVQPRHFTFSRDLTEEQMKRLAKVLGEDYLDRVYELIGVEGNNKRIRQVDAAPAPGTTTEDEVKVVHVSIDKFQFVDEGVRFRLPELPEEVRKAAEEVCGPISKDRVFQLVRYDGMRVFTKTENGEDCCFFVPWMAMRFLGKVPKPPAYDHDRPVVFYDFETTGLNVNNVRVLQVAGLRIHGTEVERFLRYVYHPDYEIPEEASKINGLYTDDWRLQHGNHESVVFREFFTFVGQEATLIAHNGYRYDHAILYRKFAESGIGVPIGWHFFDTVVASRKMSAKGTKHNLKEAAKREGVDFDSVMKIAKQKFDWEKVLASAPEHKRPEGMTAEELAEKSVGLHDATFDTELMRALFMKLRKKEGFVHFY